VGVREVVAASVKQRFHSFNQSTYVFFGSHSVGVVGGLVVIPGTKHGSTAAHVEETIVQEVGDVTVTMVLKGDLFPYGKNLLLALRRIGSIGTVETVFVLKGTG
jgi:hypothetical protein